jgi:hypothetical protein
MGFGKRAVVPDNGALHVEERLPGAHLHSCLVGRNAAVEQTNEAACNELSVTTKKRVKAKQINIEITCLLKEVYRYEMLRDQKCSREYIKKN